MTATLLAALQSGAPVPGPVALVVAHPDDETLALGGSLALFGNLLLIHVTNGAPARPDDARAAGFPTAAAYAACRAAELTAALRASGAQPRRLALGIADQAAIHALPTLIPTLRRHLAGCAAVITHAYEGGHPDHDACALAVSRACAGLPNPPARYAFPLYRRGENGAWLRQSCLPGAPPALTLALDPQRQARKTAALACFRSQHATLAPFRTDRELIHPAGYEDFTAPPHPGPLLYEGFGWGLSGADWRALAAAC